MIPRRKRLGEIVATALKSIWHYPKEMTMRERFQLKVVDGGDCHLWTGHIDQTGRGLFTINGQRMQASRASWVLNFGEIPMGAYVCHKCDNPRCVNPDHLFLGTHQDNMTDCKNKRRNSFGERHGRAKLTEADVLSMFSMMGKRYFEQREIAKHFGISAAMVNLIVKNKKWTYLRKGAAHG